MKLNVYAVFDKKVEAFMKPFEARTHGEAARVFVSHVASSMGRAEFTVPAEDLELFFLAEFDDVIGEFGVPASMKTQVPFRVITGREAAQIVAKGAAPSPVPQPPPPADPGEVEPGLSANDNAY